ncbi:rCG35673 [Rattus norvegicus]|uniref:RCG35673 n=1 Tax=Rattus norvegicus TaxID=10116 RepID=A6KF67_RAT|nr:rCG35673 [Rattus norvegicus]
MRDFQDKYSYFLSYIAVCIFLCQRVGTYED